MAENRYLIKNPVLVDNWEGTGLRAVSLYSFNIDSVDYGLVPLSAPENIWCIGFIANVLTSGRPIEIFGPSTAQPIVLSNIRGDVTVYCDHRTSYKDGYSEINELVYNGKTYYYSGENLYPMGFSPSNIINNIIPIHTEESFTSHEAAALKLIELYKAEGGLIPGEEPEPSQEYSKVEYTRINWENKSTSLKTPINESNLNKMDKAISDLCENLDISHTESDVKKLDKSSANKLLSETPTWDAETGILTFKFFDGTSFSVDFNIEKIPVSFSMDSAGVITMETADGTRWTADISEVIPSAYTFSNGARITFTETTGEDGTKKITADLVKGSITDEYLATDFLAKITSNVNAASSSAASAASSATDAAADAKLAQSYAIGGSGIRDGEDTDNAKYYAQKSAENLDYAKNLVTSGDDITE